MVPIYKNKEDIQSCTDYQEIKLMSYTITLLERIIEHRLRIKMRISENQFGFMLERSTMEVYSLRRSIDKLRDERSTYVFY